MLYKQCEYCGNLFRTYPYRQKIGQGKFCGLSCRSRGRRKTEIVGKYEEHDLFLDQNGYLTFFRSGDIIPTHLHRYIVENAIGIKLKPENVIHHIDGNKLNNSKNNLMVCEDRVLHNLIHYRMKISNAGGNWKTQKICVHCHQVKNHSEYHKSKNQFDGLTPACKPCNKLYSIKARSILKTKLFPVFTQLTID